MDILKNYRTVLALAAVCAGLATLFAYIYLNSRPSVRSEAVDERVAVVQAARDLRAGTLIQPSMVVARELPGSQVASGALRFPREAVGKVAARTLTAGEVLTSASVVQPSMALGPSYVLPPNMRAITISTDADAGVAGFIKPGDHVDVIATFDDTDNAVTRMMLQNIEVLAVGVKTEPQAPGERTASKGMQSRKGVPVTVAVTVPDAEKLVLADTQGKIRLALRPAAGGDFSETTGATQLALTGRTVRRGSDSPVRVAEARVKFEGLPKDFGSRGGLPDKAPSRSTFGPSTGSLTLTPTRSPRSVSLDREPDEAKRPTGVVTVIRGTKIETVTVPEGGPEGRKPPTPSASKDSMPVLGLLPMEIGG